MIDSFGISIFGDGYYTRIPNFGILNFRIHITFLFLFVVVLEIFSKHA
jgi:hypothetical protein